MNDLRSRFEDVYDPGEWPGMGFRELPVDVADTDEALVVTADLPGYEKDDIEVKLVEDRLHIEAERDIETEAVDEGTYLTKERRQRHASRSVSLPVHVDESDIEARYRNGVLTVTLPKLHKLSESERIEIE